MSIESVSRALNVVDPRLSFVDRLVLIGIANHDGDGGAWPSRSTLARYAGLADPRSVARSVTRLVELGYVERFVNDGGTRSTPDDRRPNRYVLAWPEISTGVTGESPEPSCEPSVRKDARGDYNAPTSEAVDNLTRAGMFAELATDSRGPAVDRWKADMQRYADAMPPDLERARMLRQGLIKPGERIQPTLGEAESAGSE